MTGLLVLLTVVVVLVGTTAGLYWYFGTRRAPVRAAVYAGCILGLLRAGLASVGWYVLEHTGGPLQIPAFAFAILAWPEAIVFAERRTTPAPATFYLRLSLLLLASTVLVTSLIGALATWRRTPHRQRPRN